jgi:RES domain-containing protein
MPILVYRVCRAVHARLDGRGAQISGGRWNSPGRAVVYTAESVALAVLENLVHMRRRDFPTGYVTVAAEMPDSLAILTDTQVAFASGISILQPQQIGDHWIDGRLSAVLRVPSAVIRGGWNYLLNPAHPEYGRIVVTHPTSFEFDPRLFE